MWRWPCGDGPVEMAPWMEMAPWRWPESNRLRQRLQGAPATLAVTPAGRPRLICHGLPFVWCARYGRVNYPACTRGFAGRLIRPRGKRKPPRGNFLGAAAGKCLFALTRQPLPRSGQPEAATPGSCTRVASAPGVWSCIQGRPATPKGQSYFPGAIRAQWLRAGLGRCAVGPARTGPMCHRPAWDRGRQGAEGSRWRGCRHHAVGTHVSLAPGRGVTSSDLWMSCAEASG